MAEIVGAELHLETVGVVCRFGSGHHAGIVDQEISEAWAAAKRAAKSATEARLARSSVRS